MKNIAGLKNKMIRPTIIKIALIVIILVLCVFYVYAKDIDVSVLIRSVVDLVHSWGIWAPVLFVGIYVLLSGNVIPSVIFKTFAGAAFGIWQGILWVTIGTTISSLIKFFIARYFFRDTIIRKINQNRTLRSIDQLIENDGWKMLIILRNVPIANALFLNYICGVTGMGVKDFASATVIGNLPKTVLFVYVGFVAGYASGVDVKHLFSPTVEKIVLVAGLLATAAATWYMVRWAKRVLAQSEAQAIYAG